MCVALDPVSLTTDNQGSLGMGLHRGQSVGDVHSIILERPRPGDVVGLVAARLQLDEHRDLLSTLRGFGERSHHAGIA